MRAVKEEETDGWAGEENGRVKEGRWEGGQELRRADIGGGQGGWAGRSGKRPDNIDVSLPQPWLFVQGIKTMVLEYDALKIF